MNRRQFFITAGKAFSVVAGATYLVGCGSTPTTVFPTPTPVPIPSIKATSTVVASHVHVTEVPLADLSSASSKTYLSTPGSETLVDHRHFVTLSSAQLATLNGGGAVTVTSTDVLGHTHDFTFKK